MNQKNTEIDISTMGGRIRALRLQKGWSQEELGFRIGVNNKSVISFYENNSRAVSLPVLQMLSKEFGTTLDYLINGMEPDMKALTELSKRYDVVGVHAFTLDADEGVTAHARNFAPLYDIDEEAATGTSSGAMTYYLYLNGVIGEKAECRFIQGEVMDRPSAILSELEIKDGACSIRVGGSAVVLAEGEINI